MDPWMTVSTPQDETPTRIALLAVGNRDAALLELMLQRFLRNEFLPVGASEAEMAIIDGDAAGAADAQADWQARNPGAPTIILSLQAQSNHDNVIYVRKPINIHTLIDMLSELRPFARRRAAPAVAAPAINAEARPRPLPQAATEGPIVVGDEGSNAVVSVEICMSNDLDEIFSASDICGPGVPHGGGLPNRRPLAHGNNLFRDILSKLDRTTPRLVH